MAGNMMPSFSELNSMGGMDFGAFQQAQNQIGLANQFAQQGLSQGNADLQTTLLRNMFDEQNNPTKLQQGQATLQGTGLDNRINSVKADVSEGTAAEQKAAAKAKFLKDADEDTLKRVEAQGQALSLRSDDPTLKARGDQMLQDTWDEQKRRAKAKDTQENTSLIVQGRKDVATDNNDTKSQIAAGVAQSRLDVQNSRNTAIANKAKDNPKNAEAAAVHFQMLADTDPDPEERARNAVLAKQYGAYSMALKNAQAGTKPDMAQFGISTNPVNMGIGTPATNPPRGGASQGGGAPALPGSTQPNQMSTMASGPSAGYPRVLPDNASALQVLQNELPKAQRALAAATTPEEQARATQDLASIQREISRLPGAPRQQPSAPAQPAPPAAVAAPVMNIPQGAAAMLKQNPALSAAFDAKYGPGASKRILGN